MNFLLIFACLLLAAVLLSAAAQRSVLSSAVIFLAGGVLSGSELLGLLEFGPDEPGIRVLAELALFSVLFTDGARVQLPDLRRVWTLPGRALLVGMPLTFAGIALLSRFLLRLDWQQSLLVGAVLSPTDPVFASAIVGHEAIPYRVRQLLNVESGINDGLALPAVMLVLGAAAPEAAPAWQLVAELLGGVSLGAAVALAAAWLELRPFFGASEIHKPLLSIAVAILILALSKASGANEYLAAFAGGVALGHIHPALRDSFSDSGERIAELFKLAAVLAFGALIAPSMVLGLSWQAYLFIALALFVVRPLAMYLALLRSPLNGRERLVAAWFGPKGFASVVFGLLVFRSDVPDSRLLFNVIAVVVASSIVLHSSSDVLFVRWFFNGSSR